MPAFGKLSLSRLETCHENLQHLFLEVVKTFDCAVDCGYRNQRDQDAAFSAGKSRLKFPYGEHNHNPSTAVDVVPFINNARSYDMRHCLHFAGYVLGVAQTMGIKIRWGGDWDCDNEAMTDQQLQDLVHFELI